MKLNLVPTYVSKERQGRTAIIGSVVLAILGIVAGVLLSTQSKAELNKAQADNDASKPPAQAAVDMSLRADTVIARAAQLIKDSNLATEMIKHNDVYPDFYTREVLPYIPSFYRINSVSAQPIDATTCNVTYVGTLSTYQQYADLVLALLRTPNAVTISRQGFTGDEYIVPGLTPADQFGRPHKASEGTIPDNPLDRLAYLQSQGSGDPGYQNVGGFGSGTTDARGATPLDSLVTIVLTIRKNLQTPDPRATLATSVAGPPAAAAPLGAFGGAPAGFAPPGAPPARRGAVGPGAGG